MKEAKRVEGFKFPQIYHTFKAKDKDSDQLINYHVQDAPKDRFEEIVDFMVRDFLPYEAMCESKGVPKNEKCVEYFRELWRDFLKNMVTLCCFKENCNDLISANVLFVHNKDDPKVETDLPLVKDILDVMNISEEQFNLFEHYKIDQCLYGFGLAVDPTYRGRGIATELLKARFPLLKTLGIKITTTAFTGPASQAAARKAGYHEDLVLQYEDMHKFKAGLYFPGIKAKQFKVMSYSI